MQEVVSRRPDGASPMTGSLETDGETDESNPILRSSLATTGKTVY